MSYFGQNTCAIEIPEYNILYVGYNNFIVPAGISEITVSASNCSVSRGTKDGRKGFYVRPSSKGFVSIQVTGKDTDGNVFSCGDFEYIAKPFPSPVILTKTISGLTGGSIRVGMHESSPLSANFSITDGVILGIDDGAFKGNIIPSEKLRSFRRGTSIGILLTVKNELTGIKENISGAIKLH